jgi:hypothetical protein
MDDDAEPQVSPEVETALDDAARNFLAIRDDLVQGANFYVRAIAGVDPPDRDQVVAWLERFAEHGHLLDEFRILGIPEQSGEPMISATARQLHTALEASLVLLLSSDEDARAAMLTVDELMERMETPEVIGRWDD